EFIDKDGNIPKNDKPDNLDPKTTSKSTTDKLVKKVTQPSVFMNFRRYYGESEMEYSEIADKYQDNPKKFYEFLKEKGYENKFKDYFINVESIKETLDKKSLDKALKIVEDLLNPKKFKSDI